MATLTDKGTNLSVREAQWSLEKSGDGQVMCVRVRLDGIPSEALQAADVLETVVEVLPGVEWRFETRRDGNGAATIPASAKVWPDKSENGR